MVASQLLGARRIEPPWRAVGSGKHLHCAQGEKANSPAGEPSEPALDGCHQAAHPTYHVPGIKIGGVVAYLSIAPLESVRDRREIDPIGAFEVCPPLGVEVIPRDPRLLRRDVVNDDSLQLRWRQSPPVPRGLDLDVVDRGQPAPLSVEEEVQRELIAVSAHLLVALEGRRQAGKGVIVDQIGAEGEEPCAEGRRVEVVPASKVTHHLPVKSTIHPSPGAGRDDLDVEPPADVIDGPEAPDRGQAVQRGSNGCVCVTVDHRPPAPEIRGEQIELAGQDPRVATHVGGEERTAVMDQDPSIREPCRLGAG